jgi:hypothetical protein
MTNLNEGDEVQLTLSPDVKGVIVAVGQEFTVRNNDDELETTNEGVLFQPDGSDKSHLFHPSCFEPAS